MDTRCRRLAGKNAIVIGGGSGIGRAGAIRMAQEGANIIIADIVKERVDKTVPEIEKLGRKSLGFVVDAAKLNELDELAKKSIDAFRQIDILVYSAGVGDKNDPILEVSLEKWEWIFAVNLKGLLYITQKIAAHMIEKELKGKIITFSSTMAKTPQGGGGGAYVASKAGVIGLTKALACELGIYNINVNCICPGLIDTPIWHTGDRAADMPPGSMVKMVAEQAIINGQLKIQRVGAPEDLAGGIAFLASSDSDYVTGQAFNLCGGLEFH
ncbi:MAG: SDR family oxidoreductase [Candidatus Schekmanbacteria bacterium]|nr:SDR family oxidoreductase [Candidatus Schekmanbacteria bacterium]